MPDLPARFHIVTYTSAGAPPGYEAIAHVLDSAPTPSV